MPTGDEDAAGAAGDDGAAAGTGAGEPSAAGAAAAARPGNRTGAWHFGHFTLNGRSGARASSKLTRFAHCGQVACTGYLSNRPSISDGGAAGLRPADWACMALRVGIAAVGSPIVSRRSCRFVRFVE